MAEYVVGISDGYHSIAFADGLQPATRLAFSITSPPAQDSAEKDVPLAGTPLAELRTGALANVEA